MTKQPINQDAEFCGRVPLHQTNLVQPHGVLLVADKADGRILQASENASEVFGLPVQELVKKLLPDLLQDSDRAALRKLLEAASPGKLPLALHLPAGHFMATVQVTDFLLIEIEKQKRQSDGEQSFVSVFQELKFIMAAIENAATTEETCNLAARELKVLSGFDKVMIYRFDEAWNGDVIAEALEPGMDSYLGLKFPASDIPKQARELYKRTPYRLIPNVDYTPVKLYPVLNPLTNAFTNLSDSNLRSVAAVHLEYLRNMKVAASMSTRILKDGELWGLIACHHRTPNYVSYETCSVFELLSSVITTKISAVEARDQLAMRTRKQEQVAGFMKTVYSGDEIKSQLRELLEADGVALVTDRQVQTEGATPSTAQISDLVDWLSAHDSHELYHQPALAVAYEPAETYAAMASGLLALPLNGGSGDFVLAFRQEAVKKITWGGNPAEAVQFEADGKGYHPRASFRQWQQTVRHTAVPWKPEVLQTAEDLRSFLSAYRANGART